MTDMPSSNKPYFDSLPSQRCHGAWGRCFATRGGADEEHPASASSREACRTIARPLRLATFTQHRNRESNRVCRHNFYTEDGAEGEPCIGHRSVCHISTEPSAQCRETCIDLSNRKSGARECESSPRWSVDWHAVSTENERRSVSHSSPLAAGPLRTIIAPVQCDDNTSFGACTERDGDVPAAEAHGVSQTAESLSCTGIAEDRHWLRA